MYFPEILLSTLVYLALIGIGVSGIVLVILLVRDIKSKKLW